MHMHTCTHAGILYDTVFLGPPPFRHRYGIRILLAKHDAQPSPTQALKTELGELKLTLGNVQSKSSSETRSIVGLVVYGLGWESDDGNDVGPGEQGETRMQRWQIDARWFGFYLIEITKCWQQALQATLIHLGSCVKC